MEALTPDRGLKLFVQATKAYARETGKKEYFLKGQVVDNYVYRVKQVYAFNNWYGFMYVMNESDLNLH